MKRKFEEQYPLRKNEQVYDQNTVRGREDMLYETSMNGNMHFLKQLMAEDPLALAHETDVAMAIDFHRGLQ